MVDPDTVASELERAMVEAVVAVAARDGVPGAEALLLHLAATLSGIAVAALGQKRATELMAMVLFGIERTAAKAAKRTKRKRALVHGVQRA